MPINKEILKTSHNQALAEKELSEAKKVADLKAIFLLLLDDLENDIKPLSLPGLNSFRIKQASNAIVNTVDEYQSRINSEYIKAHNEFWDLGHKSIAKSFEQSGVAHNVISFNNEEQNNLQAMGDMLIKDVSAQVLSKIRNEINKVVTGQQTNYDAVNNITAELTDSGHFKSISSRAEFILRNELNRAFAAAAQDTMSKFYDGGLKNFAKQWVHSHNVSNPRLGHMPGGLPFTAHGQTRRPPEFYDVPVINNKGVFLRVEKLLYPRYIGVGVTAENTINCGCYSEPIILY